MSFDRRISRACRKLDTRSISSADRIAPHVTELTLDQLVELCDEFDATIDHTHQPRDHAVPCQLCKRPTWNHSALCDRPGCVVVGIDAWRREHIG